MTKLSRRKIDADKFGHYVNNLWNAFTLLDSKADVRLLFKDLFTHTEYKMFAKRLEIARRLLNGEIYEIIQKSLSVTSGTVTRVNNILSEKGEGLRKAHEKLSNLENKYIQKQKEYTQHLSNPFLKKFKNKHRTIIGEALKISSKTLQKKIRRKLKDQSANNFFNE